jgi:hypothetical protein
MGLIFGCAALVLAALVLGMLLDRAAMLLRALRGGADAPDRLRGGSRRGTVLALRGCSMAMRRPGNGPLRHGLELAA